MDSKKTTRNCHPKLRQCTFLWLRRRPPTRKAVSHRQFLWEAHFQLQNVAVQHSASCRKRNDSLHSVLLEGSSLDCEVTVANHEKIAWQAASYHSCFSHKCPPQNETALCPMSTLRILRKFLQGVHHATELFQAIDRLTWNWCRSLALLTELNFRNP